MGLRMNKKGTEMLEIVKYVIGFGLVFLFAWIIYMGINSPK